MFYFGEGVLMFIGLDVDGECVIIKRVELVMFLVGVCFWIENDLLLMVVFDLRYIL